MLRKTILTFALISIVLTVTMASGKIALFTQTIPSIVSISSSAVIQGCSPTLAFPGNVVTGSNGTIFVSCPNGAPAIYVNDNSTPTFLLSPGYTKVAIVWHISTSQAFFCNFHFRLITRQGQISAMNLTSNAPLNVYSNATIGQLGPGQYDYCLEYRNAPVLGLTSFGISWA